MLNQRNIIETILHLKTLKYLCLLLQFKLADDKLSNKSFAAFIEVLFRAQAEDLDVLKEVDDKLLRVITILFSTFVLIDFKNIQWDGNISTLKLVLGPIRSRTCLGKYNSIIFQRTAVLLCFKWKGRDNHHYRICAIVLPKDS